MIIAGTGHRPPKLGGYKNSENVYEFAYAFLSDCLKQHQVHHIISGMALGWDQALAEAAYKIGIPFDAYVPFIGFEDNWPQLSRLQYYKLIDRAEKVHYICGLGYKSYKFQLRNEAMVDACDFVLALHNGTRGGTYNTIKYANRWCKPVVNLWNAWEQYQKQEAIEWPELV